MAAFRNPARRGMVLPLLLVILLFGTLLAGLALKEVESAAELSRIHVEQRSGYNEGLSVLGRGTDWILQHLSSSKTLPRWLENRPFEDGLLSAEEWASSGKANLLVHEEEIGGDPFPCSLEVYDLDFRLSAELENDKSLPPSCFDLFSLFGGTEMADARATEHLFALGDVVLSEDATLTVEDGENVISGKGDAYLVFEEDGLGNSLSSPNGETVIRFRLTERQGIFPAGFDLGFRLLPVKGFPEKAFCSGYSASFSVDEENHPENRDRFLLKRNANDGEGESENVLASIPFPFCRSAGSFDQERYRSYLSRPHEIRLRVEPERVTAVLDAGEGYLEKKISAPLEPVPFFNSDPMVDGLRFRGRPGGTLSVSSLRIHTTDAQGYYPECRRTGFYLVRAVVREPRWSRVFETIVSADSVLTKITNLAWEEMSFF